MTHLVISTQFFSYVSNGPINRNVDCNSKQNNYVYEYNENNLKRKLSRFKINIYAASDEKY